MILVGTHLFGGGGPDESSGFEIGIRPKEVAKAIAFFEGQCSEGEVALIAGDLNCQRPQDIAQGGQKVQPGDAAPPILAHRRGLFLKYAKGH